MLLTWDEWRSDDPVWRERSRLQTDEENASGAWMMNPAEQPCPCAVRYLGKVIATRNGVVIGGCLPGESGWTLVEFDRKERPA